ncbi:MAG: hypothetical protein K1X66_08660 [Verrucomicrobiae bacterium]|nr:hypothetical protein [Verrucomicrobiae bacterium]
MKYAYLSLILSVVCFHSLPATTDITSVKTYLLDTVGKMKTASIDFVKNAEAYQKIIQTYQGDYQTAYQKAQPEIQKLIAAMQDNYKAMDSFGYETVEAIVAGVSTLADYDIYLDAGVPKADGPENVAPVTLKLSNGKVIDQEGSLFTYLIEPALWGGNPRWCAPLDLNQDGKIAPRESLPQTEFILAVAQDVDQKITALLRDARAWQPTQQDCFSALVLMTPTLSDYFEDWKESRYSDSTSGRFSAVSRLSDMEGIMQSCSVLYSAVHNKITTEDKALAKAIKVGFHDILDFIEKLQQKENKGEITAAEIDELANQAKEKTDKLLPQIEQGAALLEIQIKT